ncbi:MAG TPA: VIT1/CCC1 transporter family protein [Candidatus Saccharimonadales bacterium]|nr:VIT1/CCC1 transporter family protein [Candidatus Saccharimonadales bacterium]
MRTFNQEYLRSVLFGLEDSLVSTTGLIAGLSVGANDKKVVVLGAVVAIAIEAISMGAGEYLSDGAVQELEKIKRHRDNPAFSGLLMMLSYLVAGMVPFLPVLILGYPASLITSVAAAFAGLFVLGFVKGKLMNVHPFRGGLKILIVGGLATIIGVFAGLIFRI